MKKIFQVLCIWTFLFNVKVLFAQTTVNGLVIDVITRKPLEAKLTFKDLQGSDSMIVISDKSTGLYSAHLLPSTYTLKVEALNHFVFDLNSNPRSEYNSAGSLEVTQNNHTWSEFCSDTLELIENTKLHPSDLGFGGYPDIANIMWVINDLTYYMNRPNWGISRRNPIKIWLHKKNINDGNSMDIESDSLLFINALRTYERQTNNAVKFLIVNDSTDIGINLSFVPNSQMYYPGKTSEWRWYYDEKGLKSWNLRFPRGYEKSYDLVLYTIGNTLCDFGYTLDHVMVSSGPPLFYRDSLQVDEAKAIEILYSAKTPLYHTMWDAPINLDFGNYIKNYLISSSTILQTNEVQIISNSIISDTVISTYYKSGNPHKTLFDGIKSISNYYWQFNENIILNNGIIKVPLSVIGGIGDTNSLRILNWKDNKYIDLGGLVVNDTLISETSLDTLKEFAIGSSTESMLPVEFNNFKFAYQNNRIFLSWQTVTEFNNYGFEIEKSDNNQAWVKLGFIKGKGTTNETQNYNFSIPITSTHGFYRLKQLDNDGKFEYSKILEYSYVPENFYLSQSYPNPFNPKTIINFHTPINCFVELVVYDLLGREIQKLVSEQIPPGIHTVSFDGSKLSSGVYLYMLRADNYTEIKKMMLMK